MLFHGTQSGKYMLSRLLGYQRLTEYNTRFDITFEVSKV